MPSSCGDSITLRILPALAVTDQDHAAAAVDVRDPEPRDLRGAQTRRISRRQRGAVPQLDTASRKCTTSSALSTTGSLRGSRAYGIRSGSIALLSVTP